MGTIECYNKDCHNPKPEDSAFCSSVCQDEYWIKNPPKTSRTEEVLTRMKKVAEEARIRQEAKKLYQEGMSGID